MARSSSVGVARVASPSPAPRSAPTGSLLDAWAAHVAVLDDTGRILEVNDAWRAFGRARGASSDFVGSDYLAVCDRSAATEPVAGAVASGLRDVLAGRVAEVSHEYRCPDHGTDRWFRVTGRSMTVGSARAMVVHEDVTDVHRHRDDVRTRSLLLDEVDAAVVASDRDGLVTTWNRAAERLYGWSADETLGRPLERFVAPLETAGGRNSGVGELTRWEGAFTVTRRDGTASPAYVRNVQLTDGSGVPTGTVGVSVDLSERLALERQLARSNRELEAITRHMGEGLCTLDASGRITYVNPHGLRLLRVQLEDARGGSFLRWLHDPDRPRDHREVPVETDVLRPVERQLIRGDGSELPIEYVATRLLDDGDGPDDATGWVVVFRDVSERRRLEASRLRHVDQVRWFERINHALDHGGLVLHGQPIVDLRTGETVQHELLLRMRDEHDPDLLIPPGRFLPTAEELGLAPAIDRWVLRRGLAIASTGRPVEINLSATSIDDPGLPDLIEELLERTRTDPSLVVFEVTETALVDNLDTARRFAERIRELGCGLALDDFGTGYGGFTYLKRLPVDYLKIDIEFVRDCVTQPASRHVVAAVVSLARAFGLRTVAEGVEDESTLDVLRELGVDLAQGYLLGRPAPLDERRRTAADPRRP